MKLFILAIFLLNSIFTYSQVKIETNFNLVYIGRNQSLQVQYSFKNSFALYGGFKYHINSENDIPLARLYKKTFYATNTKEHLGFVLGSRYQVYKHKSFSLDFFLESQYTNSSVKNINYYAIGTLVPTPTSEEDYVYVKESRIFGPVIALENIFGIAVSVEVMDHFYYTQKIGLGASYIKNTDNSIILIGVSNWGYSTLFSFGIGYNFK